MGSCPSTSAVGPSKPDPKIVTDECPKRICLRYLKSLKLNKGYFNRSFNRCYCSKCYGPKEPNIQLVANSKFTIPRGWVSYGIQVDKAFASSKKIWQEWYTTYYGTSKDKLDDILHNRFVPFPGDDLLEGKKFILNLPDQKHVYTSPSINYASLPHVCIDDKMMIDGTWYNFLVVLQCKQNPADVNKFASGKPDACNLLPNDDIQWKTDQRSSLVPIRLLIRAERLSADLP